MRIDRTRLEQSIEELGRIGATERGGLTRVALTDEDKRGRDLLVALDARGRPARDASTRWATSSASGPASPGSPR